MSGITDPTEEYFKDGLWGWDGSRWRKLGLIFGYYDRLVGQAAYYDATAGNHTLESTAVPTGELWVVQQVSSINMNTAVTKIRLGVTTESTGCGLKDEVPAAADQWVTWGGQITLKEGDKIYVIFYGCNAGDDIILRWWGYKVSVA